VLLPVAQNKYNPLLMLRSVSFAVLVALLCANLSAGAATPPKTQTGKIKGVVVDVNDARIVFAEVLVVGGGLRRHLKTNAEGEFESSLPTGEYQFLVQAEGFRPFQSAHFEITRRKTQRFTVKMKIAPPIVLMPAGPGPN
jgi:hypothetical protein